MCVADPFFCMINPLDIIGACLSVLGAYLFVKENPLAWPISILSMPFDIYLYISKGLYADTLLQLSYLLSAIYGWYHWCYGGGKQQSLEISTITNAHALALLLLGALSYCLLISLLTRYTVMSIAVFDAMAAVLSIIGQWLMCRKIIQTWCCFMLVDVIYISLYFIKQVPFHGAMMIVYFCMALLGFREWRRHFKEKRLNFSQEIPNSLIIQ